MTKDSPLAAANEMACIAFLTFMESSSMHVPGLCTPGMAWATWIWARRAGTVNWRRLRWCTAILLHFTGQ
eukprot:6456618-Amphidinium_carterae.2